MKKNIKRTYMFLLCLVSSGCVSNLYQKTYSYPHTVHAYDSKAEKWTKPYMLTDKLIIKNMSNNVIRFALQLFFDNGHQIDIQGEAKKEEGIYVFRDTEKEYSEDGKCVLNIQFTPSEINIEDNGACISTFVHGEVKGLSKVRFPR